MFKPEDFVPNHAHSAGDLPDLAPGVFGQTRLTRPTTADPGRTQSTFDVLPETSLTIQVPQQPPEWRRWEAYIHFDGGFTHTLDAGGGEIQLTEQINGGSIDVLGTRGDAASGADATFGMSIMDSRVLASGVSVIYAINWRNTAGGGTVTAVGLERKLRIQLRPIA